MLSIRSIASKLILVITVCSAVIFTVTIGYFYHSSRVTLERELEDNALLLLSKSIIRHLSCLHYMSDDTAGCQ